MDNARKIGESMRREYIDALRKSTVIDEADRAAMIDKVSTLLSLKFILFPFPYEINIEFH